MTIYARSPCVEAWGRRMLEWLSLGPYEASGYTIARLSNLKTLQQSHRASAQLMTAGFFGLVPLLIIAVLAVRRRRDDAAYALLAISLVSLVVGVNAPILTIEASKSLPLIGETVLQFESRSVLSMLVSLYQAGNVLLAGVLLGFSILIPLLKTLMVGLTFFAGTHHWSLHGLRLTHAIGKWSMADVFVVAVLVAFLASNGKGLTHAEVEIGLYFFAGYGVLSLVATQLIRARAMSPPSKVSPMPGRRLSNANAPKIAAAFKSRGVRREMPSKIRRRPEGDYVSRRLPVNPTPLR